MNDAGAHRILTATARADHQVSGAGRRSDLGYVNPVRWIMTKRRMIANFPSTEKSNQERTNSDLDPPSVGAAATWSLCARRSRVSRQNRS